MKTNPFSNAPTLGLFTRMCLSGLLALGLSNAQADTSARRDSDSVRPPSVRSYPDLNLPDRSSGQTAVDRLKKNKRLKDVADFNQMSELEMEDLFKKDKTAHLDKKGRVLFIEKIETPVQADTTISPNTTNIPLDQTFFLNSKPASPRTIYLDFNGHTTTGTAWNSSYGLDPINSPAFDLDGLPNSFNTAELTVIQNIWKRVAEDYAAFDVNITTQEPTTDKLTRSSSTDGTFGIRVVITKNFTRGTTAGDCGCGGFAYLSVFSSTSETYKPAFVFFDMLGSSEKNIAEAVTHEAGHTVGLSHDGTSTTGYYTGHGTGETGWAPIMGVGYYKNLVQWSKGEYANANNLQDDYAVMQKNGLVFDADEHGNTTATATPLSATVVNGLNEFTARGVLQGPTDIDVLKFEAGIGPVTISVSPFHLSPNIDLQATLLDANGNVLVQFNDLDLLAAKGSFSLPAVGSYFLVVEGSGKPDPYVSGYTKYGSIGNYSLSIFAPQAGGNLAPTARITSSATNGTAPASINFSATGSTDPDGSIASYSWDFGDGTTATGATVSKVYNTVGSFTAALTVTDNGGISNSTSIKINVTAPVTTTAAYVGQFNLGGVASRNGNYAIATLVVRDVNGKVVPNATLTGRWSGLVSGTASGVTNTNGSVGINSPRSKRRGTYTFTVQSITANGFTYDASKNVLTSKSITF